MGFLVSLARNQHWDRFNYLRTKIAKTIAILNNVKEFLNDKALYNAVIVPNLIYCMEVWRKVLKPVTILFLLYRKELLDLKHHGHPTNIISSVGIIEALWSGWFKNFASYV